MRSHLFVCHFRLNGGWLLFLNELYRLVSLDHLKTFFVKIVELIDQFYAVMSLYIQMVEIAKVFFVI